MPLEGHYRRVNTPLRSLTARERRVLIWGAAVTAATILVLILATVGGGHPALGPGCIRVGVPGRTGGELVSGCGKEARALCTRATRFDGLRAEMVLDSCRDRGIDFEPAAKG
jgi:type II secretory pathway component PulM